ncbi:hypothetical protein LCI18_009753 [Fusarium solani-melongenae]|uniref:Uncharacterized protein n=1 Tax=Fusarium solani subsp. cucurbitae TaxID=2747967 RepID=A0ACD3ZCN6_FUSSC|nr:hypothetical protein LCI18_009753 [Fusarium solani-melongenae]
MSATGKRKLAGPEELQRHLDDLVGSGAVVLGDGKRLRIGDDGLPEVTDSPRSPVAKPDPGSRKRLLNVISYLESQTGPKSVPWCDALASLCELRDDDSVSSGLLDMRAWKICDTAGAKTVRDIAYMDALRNELHSWGSKPWEFSRYKFLKFPQRACSLFGIQGSDNYDEQTWDNGLADQMLEKDMEAYTLIHRCFEHFMKSERCFAHNRDSECVEANEYLYRLQHLARMKALKEVKENKPLLVLERKAIIAQRIQDGSQSRSVPPNNQIPLKRPTPMKKTSFPH